MEYENFVQVLIMTKFFIGLAIATIISYLAYRAGVLDRSGGLAAGILGTCVIGLGGVSWALVLLTFFISASVISKLFHIRKSVVEEYFAKGSRRDAGQVAANGGVGGILVLVYFILCHFIPESPLLPVTWLGFAASFGAANADTWATELGVLNSHQTVLVTNFRRVSKGTSGGVSLVGSMAALCGSALVAGIAVLCSRAGLAPAVRLDLWQQFLLITISGFMGAFVDSILGATVQVIYTCPACQKETERHPVHTCGSSTIRKRGLPWLNNDWVNTACTLSAGVMGIILGIMF